MKKLFILVSILLLVGCSSDSGKINYMKAKEYMINNSALIVDVRTEEEYNEGHINGAILFTLDTIN